jgi:hypothetical protein
MVLLLTVSAVSVCCLCSFKPEELQQQVAAARAQGADLVLVFIHW